MQGIEDAADRLVQAPAQEKLRRIAQLCIALSLYIGDITSALHYSPLSPNALAFNSFVTCDFATASLGIGVAALIAKQMRIALNGIDVGSLANFSRLVWISPVIGSFTGDAWLKQIVSSLTLTSKGTQESEHEL
ncbi:unnamed protein product, partial [Symbiodinium sp. KB8]